MARVPTPTGPGVSSRTRLRSSIHSGWRSIVREPDPDLLDRRADLDAAPDRIGGDGSLGRPMAAGQPAVDRPGQARSGGRQGRDPEDPASHRPAFPADQGHAGRGHRRQRPIAVARREVDRPHAGQQDPGLVAQPDGVERAWPGRSSRWPGRRSRPARRRRGGGSTSSSVGDSWPVVGSRIEKPE